MKNLCFLQIVVASIGWIDGDVDLKELAERTARLTQHSIRPRQSMEYTYFGFVIVPPSHLVASDDVIYELPQPYFQMNHVEQRLLSVTRQAIRTSNELCQRVLSTENSPVDTLQRTLRKDDRLYVVEAAANVVSFVSDAHHLSPLDIAYACYDELPDLREHLPERLGGLADQLLNIPRPRFSLAWLRNRVLEFQDPIVQGVPPVLDFEQDCDLVDEE